MDILDQLAAKIHELQRRIEALETLETIGGTGVWIDWTPTITQSGAVTCTVTEAKYIVIGKVCMVQIKLGVTSAGTGGNAIVIGGQPAAMRPALARQTIGTAAILDTGTASYWAFVFCDTVTTWSFIDPGTRGNVGINPNFALANTDGISLTATYRVA